MGYKMIENTQVLVIAKQLLNIEPADGNKDDVLAILAEQALTDALAISNNTAIVSEFGILARMVSHLYVIRGAEHITKQTLAGVGEDYTLQYPANVMNTLKSYRKLKLL
jgi:hypothetical protein